MPEDDDPTGSPLLASIDARLDDYAARVAALEASGSASVSSTNWISLGRDNSPQSILTGGFVNVVFDTVENQGTDLDGMTWNGTDTVTLSEEGLYLCEAEVDWDSNPTGKRRLAITTVFVGDGGASMGYHQDQTPADLVSDVQRVGPVPFVLGANVEVKLRVLQDSGAPLDIVYCNFVIRRAL